MKDIQSLSIYQKFVRCIETKQLITPKTNVVLGVSGGADSVCMLFLFYTYLPSEQLTVAHFNHGIRGEEADRDENFVRNLCNQLGLQFVSECASIPQLAAEKGMGIEETARIIRYDFLHRIAANNQAFIAVAHNKNDRAETILMNIARGCSIDGLKGISYQHGKIIRPLLDLSRAEIEEFFSLIERNYVTDSTNLSDCTLRNKVRLQGIPFLDELFQQNFSEKLIHLSDSAKRDSIFLDRYAQERLKEMVVVQSVYSEILIDRLSFSKEDEAIQYRIVKMILASFVDCNGTYIYPNGKDLTKDIIDRMVSHLCSGRSGRLVEGGRNICCLIEHDKAHFYMKESHDASNSTVMNISKETINVPFEEINLLLRQKSDREEYFDKAIIDFLCDKNGTDIMIRSSCAGDRIMPFGTKGHTTVQKLLIDRKIPVSQRSSIKVVCIGNEIIWIPGIRRSEIGRVTKNTQQIIKLTLNSEA